MYAAFKCALCGELHETHVTRCTTCNHPVIRNVHLGAREYCSHFGHDGGEMRVPHTERFLRRETVYREEDGCVLGMGSDENVYSHEYLFRCARCGHERRTRY